MSSARKKSAIRKAESAAANERSQKLLAQHHADVMKQFAEVAVHKAVAKDALLTKMADALEKAERALAYYPNNITTDYPTGVDCECKIVTDADKAIEVALTEYRRQQG